MTRKGIVVIHGVGAHAQSGTLLDIGQPLLDWVARWMDLRAQPYRFDRARLAFAAGDTGVSTDPPHVAFSVEGRAGHDPIDWVMAEAWWAFSLRQPGIATMILWTLRHIFQIVAQLRARTWQRAQRLFDPQQYDPGVLARLIDLLNSIVVTALYSVAMFLAAPFMLILAVVAQIPIEAVQSFILLRLARSVLTVNVAQFQLFLDDEVQAANIRGRLERTLEWLIDERGCEELYIVAHSEGAVVAFDTLCNSASPAIASVRKLFTLGAGLNKCWLVQPEEPRLRRTLPPHVHWLDFWASYDFIPAGPLSPPLGAAIWKPSPAVTDMVLGPEPRDPKVTIGPTPPSSQVTHRMEIADDHGGYWTNDEQVLIRIAQEVDKPRFWESQFWVPEEKRQDVVARRRRRVSVLVAGRLLVMAFFGLTVWLRWNDLPPMGAKLTWLSALVPKEAIDFVTTWGARLGAVLDDGLRAALPLPAVLWLESLATELALRALPVAAIGVALLVLYQAALHLVWVRWERRERDESMRWLVQQRVALDLTKGLPALPVSAPPAARRWPWVLGLGASGAVFMVVGLRLALGPSVSAAMFGWVAPFILPTLGVLAVGAIVAALRARMTSV
ncbi:MAG: hypothetical protein HW416_2633 [Chloroflexi bacterium]|nr:hypothetical protein [Chloroflexota bacterium]